MSGCDQLQKASEIPEICYNVQYWQRLLKLDIIKRLRDMFSCVSRTTFFFYCMQIKIFVTCAFYTVNV